MSLAPEHKLLSVARLIERDGRYDARSLYDSIRDEIGKPIFLIMGLHIPKQRYHRSDGTAAAMLPENAYRQSSGG